MILSVGALIVCRCFVYACIHDVVCELILSSLSSVTPLCSHRKSFVAAASLGGRLAAAVRTTLSLLISRHKHKIHLSKALTCQPLSPPESCWRIWAPQHITLLPSLNFSLWKEKKTILLILFASCHLTPGIHDYNQQRSEPCSSHYRLLMMLI